MHIRRTDHIESTKKSPVEGFIEIIRRDILNDEEINFYLATDDKDVETILCNLFPGKILIYPKEISRTSIKGMQDALVDLYCLAATCKIYGSYFSSFSDIASRIGNIPLEIILKK